MTNQGGAEESRVNFLQKIRKLTDPAQVASITFDYISSQMPCDAGSLLLKTSDLPNSPVEAVYCFDTDETGYRRVDDKKDVFIPAEGTGALKVLQSGKEHILIRSEAEIKNVKVIHSGTSVYNDRISKSLIYWPLAVNGNIIGVISIHSYLAGAFGEKHIEIVKGLIDELSIAIIAAKAADTLKQTEDRYENLYANAPVGLLRSRITDGKLLACNEYFAHALGYYNKEHCLRECVLSELYVDPQDRSRLIKNLVEGGHLTNMEVRWKSLDGRILFIKFSGKIYPEKGYIEGVGIDVTDEREAERKMADLARFQDENPSPIIRISRDGTILYANPASQPILKEWERAQGERLDESWFKYINEAFSSRRGYEMEVPCGNLLFSVSVGPVMSESHIDLYGKDITLRRRAEERLSKINDCFLRLGPDPEENIQRLTELCGNMLDARWALYNRLQSGVLYSEGMWNVPEGYNPVSSPQGRICGEIINSDSEHSRLVRNLGQSQYAQDNPGIPLHNLQTYFGKPVKGNSGNLGSLCVLFQKDFVPDEADERALSVIASAIGIEEERKKGLEESSRFKLALERSGEAIFLTNLQGVITYVNPAFEKIYGYRPEETLGQTPSILKSGKMAPEQYEQLWKSLLEGKTVNLDFQNRAKDGRVLDIDSTANPVLDDNGNIVGFLAIQRDISERKRDQAQLQIEKAYLEQLYGSAPEAIVVVDTNGIIIRVNNEFSKIFGYTSEESIGRYVDDLLVPASLKHEAVNLSQQVAGGININLEAVRYRKDGSAVDVSLHGTPIFIDGRRIADYCIYRDITERKKAEEALRTNERFLKDVFDGIQDGISVLDTNLNIIAVNRTMEKWYASRDNLIGKRCFEAYRCRHEVCDNCPALRAIRDGNLQAEVVPLVGPAGPHGWLELFAYPLRDDNGNITNVIEYVRDITERKGAEDYNRSRTEFLAALVGLTDVSELANLAFNFIRRIMPVDSGALTISSGSDVENHLDHVFSADTGENGELIIKTEKNLIEVSPHTFTAQVFLSGQRVIIHRNEQELEEAQPTIEGMKAFTNQKSRSLAYIPLNLHGKTIGVFSFLSYSRDVFSENRIRALESAIADLAMALTAVRMTDALRDSEERYRIIAEQTGQMIYDYDVVSGKIKWSGAVDIITGYSLQEYQEFDIDHWEASIHHDDREKAIMALEQSMNTGSLFNVDYRLLCKDGNYKFVSDSGIFLRDNFDKAYRMLGTMKDITDHKLAQGRLQQSEEKYRQLIETMPNGMVISDLSDKITFVNSMAVQITGYSKEELLAGYAQDLVAEDDIAKIKSDFKNRAADQYIESELVIARKDGARRTLLITVAPLYNDVSEVTSHISIFTDITEIKNSEQEKQELRDKLARAQRMESLGVLAGGVAHDLNNILGPLVAYPELIRMKLPTDSPVIKQITKIENSAQRAAEVVQDLLTMARRGRYEMGAINLNAIIDSYLQSADFFDLKMKFPSTTINSKLASGPIVVQASEPHIYKVIMNLILNAIEAMPHGGELTIETECSHIDRLIGGFDNIESGMYAIVRVCDTGIGIDEKDLKRLFEPFYTKKVMGKSGSGLGLAIVYGVVKDHNGYVDVQSEPNQGSQFTIYLPASDQELIPEKNNSGDIRGFESVLVVDDVIEQRELAGTVLSSLGYRVEVAANGHLAVEYLQTHTVDVVILDMIMEPGFDGLDTYREILKLHPGQKAVITSGFSETDRVREAERLGVGRYIRKPYTMQKLGKAIRDVMESAEKQKPVPVSAS